MNKRDVDVAIIGAGTAIESVSLGAAISGLRFFVPFFVPPGAVALADLGAPVQLKGCSHALAAPLQLLASLGLS